MKKSLLSLLFLLAALALPALSLAANQVAANQVEYTGGTVEQHRGPDVDDPSFDIDISKTVKAVDGQENFFDITLTAKTHVHPRPELSTDVVLVIDKSYTMTYSMTSNTAPDHPSNSRLALAKAAANAFVSDYAAKTALTTRRIGIVAFDTDADRVMPMTLLEKGADATPVNNAINAITTEASGSRERYTNIEGGLRLARTLLKDSTAQYKYIVLLTDGFPTTYCVSPNSTSDLSLQGYQPYTAANARYTTADGFFAYTRDGTGNALQRCTDGTSYSDKGAQKAAAAAKQIRDDGVNIFSVGVALGSQSIDGFVKYVVDTVGIKNNTYEIGGNTASYKAWLGGKRNANGVTTGGIAGGPNLGAGKTTYFDANSGGQLNADMASILQAISVEPELDSREFYALDPMSLDVEFIGFFNKNGSLVTGTRDAAGTISAALVGQSKPNEENTANFSRDSQVAHASANNTIYWNLLDSGFVRDQLTDYDDPKTEAEEHLTVDRFTYTLKYRVRLKNEAGGYDFAATPDQTAASSTTAVSNPPASYKLTNGKTTLDWVTYEEGTDNLLNQGEMEYPIPAVEGYKGSLQFVKHSVSADGSSRVPLANARFQLIHRAQSCPICRGEAIIPVYEAISGSTGVVSFDNIPSGHHYMLHESVPPTGYQRIHDHSVVVAYGETLVQNRPLVDGVFTDNNSPFYVNNEKAIPVELQFKLHKALEGGSLTAGQFSFKMTGVTQHDAPLEAIIQSDADGVITFPELLFDTEKTFDFTITEVTGTDETIIYDDASYTVRVVAEHHNENGADDWHAAVSVQKPGETAFTSVGSFSGNNPNTNEPNDVHVIELDTPQSPFFNNRTRSFGGYQIKATKNLMDAGGKEFNLPGGEFPGKFVYELQQVDAQGNPIGGPVFAANDENGVATFEGPQHMASGKYHYTLRELRFPQDHAAHDPDFFYDLSVWDVTIDVTVPSSLTSEESFKAKVTYAKRTGGTSTAGPVFTNRFKKSASVVIQALKTLDGALPPKDAFSFELAQVDEHGKLIEVLETVTCDEQGRIAFSQLNYQPTLDAATTPAGRYIYRLSEVVPANASPQMLYDRAVYEIHVLIEDLNAETYYADVTVYRVLPNGSETLVATYLDKNVVFALEGEEFLSFNNQTLSSLPPTGDSSRLLPWLAAFAACGAALLLMRRRRA